MMMSSKVKLGLWLLAVAPFFATASQAKTMCKVIRYSADGEPLCAKSSPLDPAKSKKKIEDDKKASEEAAKKKNEETLKNSWAAADEARQKADAQRQRDAATEATAQRQRNIAEADRREKKAAKKAQKEQAIKGLIELLGQAAANN